jgi:hypothetical protein
MCLYHVILKLHISVAWDNPQSIEYIAAQSLGEILNVCMQRRLENNLDTIDLVIAGVEASLWVAEQFSSDLKVAFPQLYVSKLSLDLNNGLTLCVYVSYQECCNH